MPCVFGHDAEGASYDVNGNVESTGGFAVGVSFPELSQVENMIPHIETRGRCVTLKHGLESVFCPELEAARLLPRSAMHTDWLTLVWIVLKAKDWKFADHINLGETRSAVEVLEILAHIPFFVEVKGDLLDQQYRGALLPFEGALAIFSVDTCSSPKGRFAAAYRDKVFLDLGSVITSTLGFCLSKSRIVSVTCWSG